jgi:low affinity Fe/Cu permease
MTLTEVSYNFRRWFAQHNIPTKSVVLIINVSDRDAAARLDAAIKEEIFPHETDTQNMEIQGIEILVESPLHEPRKYLEFRTKGK